MKNICQNLNKFFDQELTPREQEDFAKHLEKCSNCQKNLKFMQEIAKFSSINENPAPVGQWKTISNRLSSTYEFGHCLWQKIAIAASFILLMAVSSFSANYFYEGYTTPNMDSNSIYSYLEENL